MQIKIGIRGLTPILQKELWGKYTILRILWRNRAQRSGFTVSALSLATGRPAWVIERSLNRIQEALRDTEFSIVSSVEETEYDGQQPQFFLASPYWQRPEARVPVELEEEPDFISLSDPELAEVSTDEV
jgi:hypothetical protein